MRNRMEDDAVPGLVADPGAAFQESVRQWQGIPTVERTAGGRLYAAWYSGGSGEGPGNYVVLVQSDDDGRAWSRPILAVAVGGEWRAFDPCLWRDPLGRLWLFWAQSHRKFDGRVGVWAAICEAPDAVEPEWGSPARLANGVMMNKPTVTTDGQWLLPVAVWGYMEPRRPELTGERLSSLVVSTDHGRTWSWRGGADVPLRTFDEHMVVERQDGSWWMLVRTAYGIGQSESRDGGLTWTPGRPSGIAGPDSRFFIRRLRSGRLLLVNHFNFAGRSHLTAHLSGDDGRTWEGGLLLDERSNVSYPDGVESPDGRIFVIYDHERLREGEILMAVFTEDDVLTRGKSHDSRWLRMEVNRLREDRA